MPKLISYQTPYSGINHKDNLPKGRLINLHKSFGGSEQCLVKPKLFVNGHKRNWSTPKRFIQSSINKTIRFLGNQKIGGGGIKLI